MTFGQEHYVPVLKGKAGELGALRELDPRARSGLTPLVEVPPSVDEVDAAVTRIGAAVPKCWPQDTPIFVDVLCAVDGVELEDGSDPLVALFKSLSRASTYAIPVVHSFDSEDRVRRVGAARDAVGHREVCLRIPDGDFDDLSDLTDDVEATLDLLACGPEDIHVVIDLGGLAGTAERALVRTAEADLNDLPRGSAAWRTVTVAFARVPQTLSGEVATRSVGGIERTDALAWRQLQSRLSASGDRVPTFGDYNIDNPQYGDFDPRFMNPAASIRYTSDDEWIVFRGSGLKGSGAGYGQFHDLAAQCRSHPAYRGAAFSWGDNFIDECASRAGSSGNLQNWRQVAVNHHLTHVTDALATRSVP